MLGILEAGTRQEAIRELRDEIGAEEIFLFIADPERNIPLPAPGFVQVVPETSPWKEAVQAAAEADGAVAGFALPYPEAESRSAGLGVGCHDGTAFLAVGGASRPETLLEIHYWLPWLSKAMRAETVLCRRKAKEGPGPTAVQAPDNRMSGASESLRKDLEDALRRVESARGRSEKEKEERQKFVLLVENSGEFIGMASLEGSVTFLNAAGRRMAGLRSSEPASGRTLEDFLPAEMRPDVQETIIPFTKARGQWEGEMQLRHFPSGRRIDVWMNIFLVRDMENHEPVCLAMAARDVTERKRSEEALRKTEEQLQQSQKMESIGKLAGGIAHDFNNLLTAINGYAELSMMGMERDHPLHGNLYEIKRAGERAASLTRQLLAYSRKQVLATKVLNINTIVDDMHNMLTRIIGEDLQMIRVLEPRLGRVKVDPGQLEQVILNLVVNARDATPGGGVIVLETRNAELGETAMALHPEVVPGAYVMLAVTDSGTGMDEHTRARIFEPFFTTKAFGMGSGMGLSMVQGIVAQSGGYIYVYSEPGNGSTFKIYLPSVGSAEPGPLPAGEAAAPSAGGSETILLVEDEESVRRFARQILEARGYTVLEARDGMEGADVCALHQGPIDLVLSDVIMPRKNGRELAEHVARERPGARIVFMSGYTDDAVVRQGLLGPDMNFVQKPFSADALARVIRIALDAPSESRV